MPPAISVGVRLPQYGASWGELLGAARRAEDLGFAALWLNDHLQAPGRHARQGSFEALTALAAIAASTTAARLGVAVMSASYRRPAVAARMVTTLDNISSGRLTLGLGTGSDRDEHRAYGIPFGSPRERSEGVVATLDVLQAMFREPQSATVPGEVDAAPNLPGPLQAGGPPVWLAAHGPTLLRVAGRRADGVVAAFLTPGQLAHRRELSEEARESAGRQQPLRYCLYCYAFPVLSDRETRRFLEREADLLGTSPPALVRWLRTVGLVGTPDEIRGALASYADAGMTDAVLVPPNGVPLDFYDALADALPATGDAPTERRRRSSQTSPAANLAHLLVERQRATGLGGSPAAIDPDGAWTFDELAGASARAAGALSTAGVRRGERVAVMVRDGRPWLAGFLGAAWLGAIAVPIDPGLDEDRLHEILADLEPALVIARDEDAPRGQPSLDPDRLTGGHPARLAAVHPDDLGYLIYSSGSTGQPKAAMHSHGDMRTSLETYVPHALGLGPADRLHAIPRLFTSLGFGNGFFRALGSGSACVLSPTTPTPRSVLGTVVRHGVTVLTAVPTFWSQLARFLERHGGGERLATVRLAVSSGDALPPAVAAALARVAGLDLIQGLGCSECSNVIITERAGEHGAPGTLGHVVPGVEVKLADADGHPVAEGEPGRLWVRSGSNTSGYWRRSALTRDLVRGDWIRMGDVLSAQDGVYRHLGRSDDLFKVDARWVSPSEVEASLVSHPDVEEAAVVGRADEHGLVRVVATVATSDGAQAEGLAERLRAHVAHDLARHCAPQSVEVVDALPRLPSGKLDRRALRSGV